MRRGNLLWIFGKSVRLPRQCAHWLAMTPKNDNCSLNRNLSISGHDQLLQQPDKHLSPGKLWNAFCGNQGDL